MTQIVYIVLLIWLRHFAEIFVPTKGKFNIPGVYTFFLSILIQKENTC